MKIFVAGGTGLLGREVVAQLLAAGHAIRLLSRKNSIAGCESWPADLLIPRTLQRACDGADAVISCAGASMKLGDWWNRKSFAVIDHLGNSNLLQEAERAGVSKFVYVSLHSADRLLHTEYASGHERFVHKLAASPVPHSVVRPTGFFGFVREIQAMAEKGRGIVIGDGKYRTNPVHEADVAGTCIHALTSDQAEIPIGGPDVFTREEIVRLAFQSLGTRPSVTHVPAAALRLMIAPVKLINPRIHALMSFGIEVSITDVVAPQGGRHRLEEYFANSAELAYRTQSGAT